MQEYKVLKALLSAAAVCVSVEFFLITSQRSCTIVRQKERRVRESGIEEGKGWEGRQNIDRNRKTELHSENRGSEGR